MSKLAEKMIPKKFHDLSINTEFSGNLNVSEVFSNNGAKLPKHKVHIEPVRGKHQGYSMLPELFQVVLPNDDRVLTKWARGQSLIDSAMFYISSKNGVVTALTNGIGSTGQKKTLSEIFNTHFHYNASRYPLSNARIGDYGIFEGFKFRQSYGKFEALNPRDDVRIATDRKISGRVRREIRAVEDVVDVKSEMVKETYFVEGTMNKTIIDLVSEMTNKDREIARRIVHIAERPSLVDKQRICVQGDCRIGKVVTLHKETYPRLLIDITKGNVSHELFVMVLAGINAKRHRWAPKTTLMDLAPLFIAARGGYSFVKVERK